MHNDTYSFSEIATIIKYFNLSNSDVQQKVKSALKGENYTYHHFIKFACDYLVNIAKISDFTTLLKCIFRYTLLLMYIAFKDPKIPQLNSEGLNEILESTVNVELLCSNIDTVNENDIWGTIYNKCKYDNDFDVFKGQKTKPTIKHAFERTSKALYKQQSYFQGDKPIFDSINPTKNNIYRFEEFICDALHSRDSFVSKEEFEIKFKKTELPFWTENFRSPDQISKDIRILCFILKEAIFQNKTGEGDEIKVESLYYYQAVMNLTNGSFKNIPYIAYNEKNETVSFLFNQFNRRLFFYLNNKEYFIGKYGIKPIQNKLMEE